MNIAVLGAGAWGTALAISLSERHALRLWGRNAAMMRAMAAARCNTRYLPDVMLPDTLRIEEDFPAALQGAELLVLATPMAGLRETLRAIRTHIGEQPGNAIAILWLCKGFERGSAQLPHQVAREEWPSATRLAVLSGPSFAADIARGLPAAVTLAARDGGFAQSLAAGLNSARLRIYSSEDLTGVEVGGAVKNVIAIAAGISDGLGLGASARAALITRGLAEITRLGVGLGGRVETFLGLAGAGDLMLTCTTDLSRNRKVGLALAGGKPLTAILADLGHVAEGVLTAREAHRLARRLGVETPIVDAVCDVLDGKVTPQAAVEGLMRREPRPDHPLYE